MAILMCLGTAICFPVGMRALCLFYFVDGS